MATTLQSHNLESKEYWHNILVPYLPSELSTFNITLINFDVNFLEAFILSKREISATLYLTKTNLILLICV